MVEEIFAFLGAIWFIVLALCIFFIFVQWKIFEKAGEKGWKSLIPFYSTYILWKIAWGSGWMFLTTLIPFVGFVFGIICNVKLAQAFGKGIGFAIGLIFLPVIFEPILAFGDSQYLGPQ